MSHGNAIPTVTSVSSSASVVDLLVANNSRIGMVFFNSSTQVLYIKFGSGASATDYTYQIASNGYWWVPNSPNYQGVVTGIWASANGSVKITEFE